MFAKVRYSKSYVDFMLKDWLEISELNKGISWANSSATMSFQFSNSPNQLTLYLLISPVGQEHEHIREAIPVIASYADALGIRAFAEREDLEHDIADRILSIRTVDDAATAVVRGLLIQGELEQKRRRTRFNAA